MLKAVKPKKNKAGDQKINRVIPGIGHKSDGQAKRKK